MPRILSALEIAKMISVLRSEERDWISRGRGGSGFGHRDGKIFRIYVEEFDREEVELSDTDLFTIFATMDVSATVNRYDRWVLEQMGVIEPS
jgi:hypothetical protein